MKRRCFIKTTAFGAAIGSVPTAVALFGADDETKDKTSMISGKAKLNPPTNGRIPVAVLISEGVTVIDFAGPWEVFQDVMVGDQMPFQLFTVSDNAETITATGGLKLFPNYTFANVPE